ncbi:MAG: hypothetical protein K9G33_15805, partial [Sneathiella sp.]|nr:hypothetical protein [Sneathiella sp.]
MSYLPDVFVAMSPRTHAKTAIRICLLAAGLSFAVPTLVPTAAANTDEPDYFKVNMKPGSKLNVRKDPSLKAPKIGALPAQTAGIVNLGCHIGMPYLEWRQSTTAIRK